MVSADPTDFLNVAPWFVPQINTALPETIHAKNNYDENGTLADADTVNIRLHLERNAIVRHGKGAGTDRNLFLYDFSLDRMARHEIIAELITRYSFDSKEHFLSVCQALDNKIRDSNEMRRLYWKYDDFWSRARNDLTLAVKERLHPAPSSADAGKEDMEAKAELVRKADAYKTNIETFNFLQRLRTDSQAGDALSRLRDEWAEINPGEYRARLITPAIIEEERIRWKQRELRTLIGGTPEEGFERGLLARSIAELAEANDAFKSLKPLEKFGKEKRKSFLVVGGQGAGKSTIIRQIRRELPSHTGVATLNTDWIKSMLLDGMNQNVANVTQLGSLTHQESSYVFDLAADRWRSMARDEGLAPHLIAEAAQAASWQIDLASAGDTRTDIRVAVAPPLQAVQRAYKRGQPGGDDVGRFPPTQVLLDSHRDQFDNNLAAMIKGLPLTFFSTASDDIAETKSFTQAVRKEYPPPKTIATYDPESRILQMERLPEMLDYFNSREINVYACHPAELHDPPMTVTAANMLEYARHMELDASNMELKYAPESADQKQPRKYTCEINNWKNFCGEMGSEGLATEFVAALAQQTSGPGAQEYSVEFITSAKDPSGVQVNDIVAGARQEQARDSYLKRQAMGRQLTQQAGKSLAASYLKQYAATLRELAGSTKFSSPGYHVAKSETWLNEGFPQAMAYLRRTSSGSQASGNDEYFLWDAAVFKDPVMCFNRLGKIDRALARGNEPHPDDVQDMRLVSGDDLAKHLDHKAMETMGITHYIPKASNQAMATKLEKPVPFFDGLPADIDDASIRQRMQGQSGDWLVMPRRYHEGLKNQMALFDVAVNGQNPDWERALSCLFHADGSARFPCIIMDNKDFRKSLHEVPAHDDEYMAMLAQIVNAYYRYPEETLKADHTGQKAYLMVQGEKGKNYHLPGEDGHAKVLLSGNWFGIEVSIDGAKRRAEVEALHRSIIHHDIPREKSIQGFANEYVVRCCKPVLPAVGEDKGADPAESQAGWSFQNAKRGNWRRRDGIRPGMRFI